MRDSDEVVTWPDTLSSHNVNAFRHASAADWLFKSNWTIRFLVYAGKFVGFIDFPASTISDRKVTSSLLLAVSEPLSENPFIPQRRI